MLEFIVISMKRRAVLGRGSAIIVAPKGHPEDWGPPGGGVRPLSSLWRKREPNCSPLRLTSRDGRSVAMQATSDEVLIGRIANGDRLAMQVLYARHHVRVFRFVVRLVRDEATAEDLI